MRICSNLFDSIMQEQGKNFELEVLLFIGFVDLLEEINQSV